MIDNRVSVRKLLATVVRKDLCEEVTFKPIPDEEGNHTKKKKK